MDANSQRIPDALIDSLAEFAAGEFQDLGPVGQRSLLGSPVLAKYWAGEYGCSIVTVTTAKGWFACLILFLHRGWGAALACPWHGEREAHWGISSAEWRNLPPTERALRECQEQVERWVPAQIDEEWLNTYYPFEWVMVQGLDAEERGRWPEEQRAKILARRLAGVLGPEGWRQDAA